MSISKVQTGIEKLINSPPEWIKGKKIGLLMNPASVLSFYKTSVQAVHESFPGQLIALFTPQHGYYASKQDNMIESEDLFDLDFKIPIYSLYSKTRIPDSSMMDNIDILFVDIQDVGTRVYTFIYTISYCMEAAGRSGTKVVILDRPNPISGEQIEGNCLNLEYASFVGRFPIPMRHGLTVGEIAILFNKCFGITCDLQVIPMTGWNRSMYFNETGLPWIAPSPNMPSIETAKVYPGQVIWEGTNISEGRGTTQPFEIFGAPFVDTKKVIEHIGYIEGAFLRPICFEPTFHKFQGELCRGFQIHVVDQKVFKPYLTTIKLLQAIIKFHPESFEWKQPPYEYEFEKMPIDLILGDKKLRQDIESLVPISLIENNWQSELKKYNKNIKKCKLYE